MADTDTDTDTDARLARIEAAVERIEQALDRAETAFEAFRAGPGQKILRLFGAGS